MRQMSRLFRSTTKRLRQRGSALLASLMVIVGLSLLGLAFVAISETESAISVHERNHTQTVALAETGARIVVQWFQHPTQMKTGGTGLGLMPVNDVATSTFKIARDSGSSTTFYKPDAGSLFCDLPFGPADKDKFFGFEDSADLMIDRTTAAGQTFLDTFNTKLLGPESTTDA